MKGERIAKVLARAGVCSRRAAERAIAEGRVKVDGKVIDSPALNVGPGAALVFDGKPVPDREPRRLWLYHKPKGLVTSHRDPRGRPTVFEALPRDLPRVISVGRLDINSEGLLLLTNDGELARHLELPARDWTRHYRVRVRGAVKPADLTPAANGLTVDGIRYGPVKIELERQLTSNAWLHVALREGKKREVRRVLEHLGYPVGRLIRTAYGPFQLGKLEAGKIREVPGRVLDDQIGAMP